MSYRLPRSVHGKDTDSPMKVSKDDINVLLGVFVFLPCSLKFAPSDSLSDSFV